MNSAIFRHSIYATLALLALSAVHFFIVMPNADFETNEIAGYLTMILSMVFVFTGIRYYRDHVNNGSLSFVQGLKTGALIVLIPAISFGLFDVFYTEILNPSWSDDYFNYYIQKIKASTPPDQLEKKLKQLQDDKEMFDKPIFQFLLMAGTVFVIGFIVTIISTLALRRTKPAARK